MAVDDAAFIHCWRLPEEDPEEVELVTIEDSASQHSIEVSTPWFRRLHRLSLVTSCVKALLARGDCRYL